MAASFTRLYIVLHRNPGKQLGDLDPAAYHWALQLGPDTDRQNDSSLLLHVRKSQAWSYEARAGTIRAAVQMLIRLRIGRITDADQVRQIARAVPVRNDDPKWNCVSWIREALARLDAADGIVVDKQLNFEVILKAALEYMMQKESVNRFKQSTAHGKLPTWDVVHSVELVD